MATILTKPAFLADTELKGQVVVLDIDGVQLGAPTKKKPWWKVNVEGVLPEAPTGEKGGDVRWLTKAEVYVVAVFPDGTFDTSAYPTREVSNG